MAMNYNPSYTYTLDDFREMQLVDDMTYYNFSIIEMMDGVQHLNHNLIEDYLDELKSTCVKVELNLNEFKKYKYYPDMLAYDIYGSVQLDFILLLLNDCIDPKEFDKRSVILPYASVLASFLNTVFGKEQTYLEENRVKYGLKNNY